MDTAPPSTWSLGESHNRVSSWWQSPQSQHYGLSSFQHSYYLCGIPLLSAYGYIIYVPYETYMFYSMCFLHFVSFYVSDNSSVAHVICWLKPTSNKFYLILSAFTQQGLVTYKHIGAETQWATFCRWHFNFIFLNLISRYELLSLITFSLPEWKFSPLLEISLKFFSQEFNKQIVTIGSDSDLDWIRNKPLSDPMLV